MVKVRISFLLVLLLAKIEQLFYYGMCTARHTERSLSMSEKEELLSILLTLSPEELNLVFHLVEKELGLQWP